MIQTYTEQMFRQVTLKTQFFILILMWVWPQSKHLANEIGIQSV